MSCTWLLDLPLLSPLRNTSTDSLLAYRSVRLFSLVQCNVSATGPTSEPFQGVLANGQHILMISNLNGAITGRYLNRTDDSPESCRKPMSSLKYGGGRIPPKGFRMMIVVAEPKPHTCPTST
jgi:hypothetical protein